MIVILIYTLAVLVSSAVFPHEELADMGETAMVEVARELAGKYGGLAILVAGLLATLSSANASILSSSRTVFALGKDQLIPHKASNVNQKFKTPHWSIILAGIPIAAITLYDRIEILTEVASFLHLIIYGGICISLIQFKRK